MIDVVCNIDDNYTEYCGVTLSSLFASTPEERFRIHIICHNLSDRSKDRLTNFCGRHGNLICFYEVSDDMIKGFPIGNHKYISVATYLRLFMSDLLPDDIDKVLYLDCDIMVIHSVKELWNIDVSDVALAGVEDQEELVEKAPMRLGYPQQYGYVNAGVLLVNLKYWREKHLTECGKKFIMENRTQLLFHDQDVLNALFYNNKKLIPMRWNLMDFFLMKNYVSPMHRKDEYQEALKNPVIIHFTGAKKPWMHRCSHPFQDSYIRLAHREGWKIMSIKEYVHYILRKWLYRVIRKKSKMLTLSVIGK